MPTTHRLGRDAIHTYWDRSLPPRLTIAPGDTVTFDTLEASYGSMAREVAADPPPGLDPAFAAIIAASAYPEATTPLRGHALTGPVFVQGAAPGDILAIEIRAIIPAAWGWTASGPSGLGLLRDEFTERVVKYWDLRDGSSAGFAPGIRVPLEPFCGVMGLALAEPGMHRTGPPRHAGGNMDIRQLTVGTTLYLPVQVPGALFSVGAPTARRAMARSAAPASRWTRPSPCASPSRRAAPSASPNSSPPGRSPRAPTPAPTSPPPRTTPTSTRPRARPCAACSTTSRTATASTAATPASSPAPASISASARSSTPRIGPSAPSCR